MYKRRIKRTVSASPVAIRTQNVKSSNELDTSAKKLDLGVVSEPDKEKVNVPKERRADHPLPVSRQKSCNAVLQSEVSQSSGTKARNMRFATQDKQQVPYFEKVLSSCGFNLRDSEAYVLSEDQTIFIQDLKNKLEKNSSFPLNVTGSNGFIPTLEEFFNDPENLKKSLQLTKSPESSHVWRNSQDSLMHLLLSVDFLQKRLVEFLCEKLVELVCSNEREAESANYPWTQMILRQFKFLDHIVDPDAFLSMLFDVLSSVPEKGDVLYCLPDIILDSQHEETAKKLSELLLWDCEMSPVTPSILDALTNLTLTPELQKSVSENVMKCLGSVQLDYLPNVVRFLVTVTNSDEMPKIVSSFRQHLDFTSPLLSLAGNSSTKGSTSVENCELLTVEVLKLSVMSFRAMAEAWLNAIKGVHSASKHKPLDLIMLLVLHANVPVAQSTVQALFKSKARLGIFREKLLVSTFSTMLVVIKEYRSALMEILFVLLKSPDPAVVDHASCWYKLCLLHLPSWQAQAVVQRLLIHVGTGSAGTMRAALSVLTTLAMENLSTLLPHQWLLLNLLDKVPDVDASVVEMIMEMLCRVAFGSETHSGSAMDDNILMLARKQLASWSPEVRKKGVIGAILAAKHMASKETGKDSVVGDNIKQAIELMEWVTTSTEYFPDATGLFLDKLSSVLCSVEVLNDSFLSWITDYIGQSFEEKYVVPRKGLTFEEDLKLMFNLDEPEEDDDDVCIPIAQLVDRDCLTKRSQYPPIVVMPASLRLVRCVKYLACEGNLGDIAALLTCPVLMPCIVEQEEGLDFSCPQEQNFLLDCIFHCVNWFRELISAFAYQKNAELRRCVLLRLQSLVDLQKKLAKWLTHAIDYVPPPCQFFASAKPPKLSKVKMSTKKKGKKRKRKSKKGKKKPRTSDASENAEGEEVAEDEDEEIEGNDDEDDENDVSLKETPIIRSSSIDLIDYRGFLRELDVDVVILLTEQLDLSPAEGTTIKGLTPPVLLFLLQDLTSKVEYLLAPEAKRISALKTAACKPVGFANLETFAPRSFARNTIKLLPALTDKLEAIAGYCQALLDKSDNIRDAPSMFPEGSFDIKSCYSYILRILAGLFHWSGFESKVNTDSLRDALKLLVVRDNKQAAENNRVQGLLVDAATYITSYVERTLVLSAACSLVKLLTAFCHLVDGSVDETMHKQIENACKTFLGQRWYNFKGSEEKGAEFNHHVDTLVKSYFSNMINKLETVSDLVAIVYQEVETCVKLGTKDWSLDTFPTVTKSNFTLLYRALCLALVQGLEDTLEGCANDGARFKAWESAIESLRGLMMIARSQNTRSNLVAFVKNALRLLRTFLKRGLPMFIQHFRSRTNQVTSVLSTLQKSTRFLNSICYHSKSTKDATLTSLVPALRFVLEQIVVSVRTMLAKNDCRDAFWIGILKNRNLKGEEVLSQESEPAAEEEQEEQELPSDDDSDVDVDLANAAENEDDQNDATSSISEVF